MAKKSTKHSKKSKRQELTRFAQYMVGGGVWFWSGYVLIVVLNEPIGLFWANLIGNTVGITLNFLVQRYWAFSLNKKERIDLTAGRYIVYTALNAFLLNYFILYALQQNGIGPAIGQFIASGFFTAWNYYWYKHWVFKTS